MLVFSGVIADRGEGDAALLPGFLTVGLPSRAE